MSDWGGERLKAKNLHQVEKKSLERYRYARKYCRGKKVLDAACGCGYGSYILSRVAKRVLALDYSKEAIDFANKWWLAKNIKYCCFNLNQDLTTLGKFEAIVSLETVEHLKTPILKTCRKFYELLSFGGLLILSHPEKEVSPKQKSHRSSLERFLGLINKNFLQGKRKVNSYGQFNPFHKHFNIDGEKLKNQLLNLGFRLRDEWYQPPRFYYYYHLLVLEKK